MIKIVEGGAWKVYTDASYEPGADQSFCGLGGVLVNPKEVPLRFFSFVLTSRRQFFLVRKFPHKLFSLPRCMHLPLSWTRGQTTSGVALQHFLWIIAAFLTWP